MRVTSEIEISDSEFQLSYARSSGPGGQNVNKVNSKVVLHWNLRLTRSLSPDLKARVLACLGSVLTATGELVISSDRFRDQARNRADCFEKLKALLRAASAPLKRRKKTKPTRASRRKTKEWKTRHSEKKKLRRDM